MEEDQVQGLLYMLDIEYIDPAPFFTTLGWENFSLVREDSERPDLPTVGEKPNKSETSKKK